jgi:asparagine synthase (glutamine-hydrolysing)
LLKLEVSIVSVIFGVRRPLGAPVQQQDVQVLASATLRYAHDGTFLMTHGNVGMGFQPYHTHVRSHLEAQPIADPLGNMLVFDGRLDNWDGLQRKLRIENCAVTDSEIVLAAFGQWGERCFSQFIGDWALALWSAADQALYLARDHAGTRSLYFSNVQGNVTWSTYLETLVEADTERTLDEDYIACYLGLQPIRDLTPYRNVRAVPPAHYIVIRGYKTTTTKHWEWMVKPQLCYKREVEYDEHFLSLFQQAVERRDQPNTPVVAELSGGMDSSGIVCMSDYARRQRGAASMVDTVSYYRDSEPHWNERPYFLLVEEKRGKAGVHIDVSPPEPAFNLSTAGPNGYLFPANPRVSIELEKRFQSAMDTRGFRAVLSGIGGDELLGGVPTLLPELAGYLTSGKVTELLRRAMQSCLLDRKPVLHLLKETAFFAFQLYGSQRLSRRDLPRWLSPEMCSRCVALQRHDRTRGWRLGPSPNTVICDQTWWSILETCPHLRPMHVSRYEFRYPYLDRDLVEYLYQVPREQLVKPGRRRNLMRRALREIVPIEILERKRKAFVVRGPLSTIQLEGDTIRSLLDSGWLACNGYVDRTTIHSALDQTIAGTNPELWPGLMKAATFEMWLKSVAIASPAHRDAPFNQLLPV